MLIPVIAVKGLLRISLEFSRLDGEIKMIAAHRAIEAILTLLQVGPITVFAIRSHRLGYWLGQPSGQAKSKR